MQFLNIFYSAIQFVHKVYKLNVFAFRKLCYLKLALKLQKSLMIFI